MLRLVIPISHVDSDAALRLLEHLSGEADDARKCPLTIVLSMGLAGQAEKFRTAGKEVSEDVTVKVLENENEEEWPQSANHVFRSAVQHLLDSGNTLPWLWLEADSTPLTRDWVTRIATEYNQCRKPYLGTARAFEQKDAIFPRL